MIHNTRTNYRQQRYVENRYITRRNRKFESIHVELTRDDILDMVEEALSNCPYNESNDDVDGTSAYLSTYDRYGSELSYQGYITLVKVAKDALYFNTVYPSELTLSKVVDIDKFKPAGPSRDDIEEALDEATYYRDNGELDTDIAYAMSEHGYVENLDISFKDLFDEVTFDDDLNITLDENGKPILKSDDDLRVVSEIAVKYLGGELEAYISDVSRTAENVISDLESEMDDIIEDLENALDKADESRIRDRRFGRRR
jgi:hypothetical protein